LGVDWPFIQAFDFTQGDFDIVLEQAGTDEVVRIDHNNEDLDDYASLTLDRNAASEGSDLFLLINDQQLNIDPTDEDVIMFKVSTLGNTGVSTVAWTNGTIPWEWADAGAIGADMVAMDRDIQGFGDNGRLSININATESTVCVLEKDATEDDTVIGTDTNFMYLIFYEDADNTGTFSNVDNDDNSNIDVVAGAIRGTTAVFDYNDTTQSFTVTNDFAVIDMDETTVGDEWNSGEALAITLTDQDLNKNTWLDEDLTLADPSGQQAGSDLIPSMQIGSPLSLTAGNNAASTSMIDNISNATIQTFSKIGIATEAGTDTDHTGTLAINTGILIGDLRSAVTNADYIFLNYDVTSLVNNSVTAVIVEDDDHTSGFTTYGTPSGDGKRDLVRLQTIASDSTFLDTEYLRVNFTTATAASSAIGDRYYVDIFTFGDGTTIDERVNNALYRFELEETDNNTGTFIGEVEYIMLNQLNVDSAATFSGITPTSDDVTIIVHEDLTDEDSPLCW
jgi:hypothetical protein